MPPARVLALLASLGCATSAVAHQNTSAPLPPAEDRPVQDSTKQPKPKKLETIVVTGTHIRGVDLEDEHPITTLKREDLVRTGLTGIADIVQSLIVANGQTLNRNIDNGPDSFGSGYGELRVNLRSLGANRTLVLVNGQRWVSAVDGAVDLSAIPFALVERVDVLKDGASAVYGSDAIGGVVNIITRQNYRGAEAGLNTGETDHGDGFSRYADFAFGRSGSNWNGFFGLEYSKDDAISSAARGISSVPSPGLPLGATGSPATQYGVFRIPGVGAMTLIPGRPGTSPDDFRLQNPATDDNYNYMLYNYVRTPQERRAAFGQMRWDISPSLAFVSDALFNQRISAQQLEPPAVNFSPLYFAPGSPQAVVVSADSIYNPFGVEVPSMLTRWPDSEARRWRQTVDTARFHLGFDGLFALFGRDWSWNADAVRTRAVQGESGGPYVDSEKLALGRGPSFYDTQGVARCGTRADVIADCVPVDLFTGPGRLTPAMLAYVNADVHSYKRARSDLLNFTVSSSLADLPAGSLGFAAGLERRLERGSVAPDPLIASGRASGTALGYGPTSGAYAVNEAYLELDVPLIAGKPLARQLDVNLATRHSNYSLFGGTDNSRIGLRWKPVDDLLVRSTWAQGFRAPSIFEAFGGTVEGLGSGARDICATDSDHHYVPPPALVANCVAHGVPANVALPEFGAVVATGSNPALKPETSRSVTAGLVYSPGWFPGLDVSADWYRIEIRNAVGNPGAQFFVNACYKDNDAAACSHITRFPDGVLAHVTAINENLPGGVETEGWDFGLSWKHATPYGAFDLRWESAYVDYWGAIGKPATGALLPDGSVSLGNAAGVATFPYGVIWRLRSVASLGWQRGRFGASVSARYFSSIMEDCSYVTYIAGVVNDPSLRKLCTDPDRVVDGEPAPLNRVGAVTYVDLEASWEAPWHGRFTIGARNALDREPPLSRWYVGGNSFFPDYDIPGRFFYVSYRQKF